MSTGFLAYNLTLNASSPAWSYSPSRDASVTQGWNSSYTGNLTWPGGDAASTGVGSSYRRTQLDSATASLTFNGTALYLCLGSDPGATYSLTVDGQTITKTAPVTDPACAAGADTLLVADGLSNDVHLGVLSAHVTTPNANVDFFGGLITLNAGASGYSNMTNTIWIDDEDSGWQWTPGRGVYMWDTSITAGSYGGSYAFECNYGPTIMASYIIPTGVSAIQLLGPTNSAAHYYSVQLDGVQTEYDATDTWSQPDQVLFFAGGLDPTRAHNLTFFNYDSNEPNCNAGRVCCANIDALVVVKPVIASPPATSTSGPSASSSSSSTSGPSSSSTPVGAIAGGVVGGVVLLALLSVFVLLCLRRRRRARDATYDRSGNSSPMYQRNVLPEPYLDHPTNRHSVLPPVADPEVPAARPLSATEATSSTAVSSSPVNVRNQPFPPNEKAARPSVSSVSPASHPSGAPYPAGQSLRDAPTLDLVQVLQERLRDAQVDNLEEPPEYAGR